MAIDAVIFDWGGTLTPWHDIDLIEPWRAYATVIEPGDPDPVAAALLASEDKAWAAVREEQRSSTFAQVLATAGVDHHDEAAAAYRKRWEPHTFTDSDVPGLFAGLRDRGIRVGVLSNTIWPREWHRSFFDRDRVLGLIDGDVYTSEIDHTKPHEAAFRAAMAAVGVDDPSRCVFVGDRPFDDITGAHSVGMRAVLVPHSKIPAAERVPVAPDATVDRVGQVLGHVDEWHAHR